MPSVSSSSRPKVLLSSTVMTPSLPTLSIASAMISPTVVSAAEIEAVAAICSLVSTSLDSFDSSSETRLSEHGGGGGAVTGYVISLLRDLFDECRPHVLEGVLELDLLGDGNTVVG